MATVVMPRAPGELDSPMDMASLALVFFADMFRVARSLLGSDRAAERAVLAAYEQTRRSWDLYPVEDLRLLLYRALLRQIDLEAGKWRNRFSLGPSDDPYLVALRRLPRSASQLLVLADAMELSVADLAFVLKEKEADIPEKLLQARDLLRQALPTGSV